MILPLVTTAGIQDKLGKVLIAGFFAGITIAALVLLQMLGARLYNRLTESGRKAPLIFGAIALFLGIAGLLLGSFLHGSMALLVGLTAGFLVWASLGEIGEQLGYVSTLSRSAVPLFLCFFALWLIGFLFRGIPIALTMGLGYPVCIWGLQLVRVRVLAKWGPSSLAATILALACSAVAGGGLALGMAGSTPLTGIVGGVVFAMAGWSTVEIIWEKGMARKPWHR